MMLRYDMSRWIKRGCLTVAQVKEVIDTYKYKRIGIYTRLSNQRIGLNRICRLYVDFGYGLQVSIVHVYYLSRHGHEMYYASVI